MLFYADTHSAHQTYRYCGQRKISKPLGALIDRSLIYIFLFHNVL